MSIDNEANSIDICAPKCRNTNDVLIDWKKMNDLYDQDEKVWSIGN